MGQTFRFFHFVTLVGLASMGSAFAAELPKEGSYDFTACWSGVSNMITFSKTHTASSYEMTGTIRSNPPDGMFDKNSFRCVGMNASLAGSSLGPPYARQSMWTATNACQIFCSRVMEVSPEKLLGAPENTRA